MKRWMLGVIVAFAVSNVENDGVVAGSKWKPWKHAGSCAAPTCSGPTCYAPSCFSPGCYAPGCFGPTCSGCSQPGCFAPSCSGPWFSGCSGPLFSGCSGCSAPTCSQPFYAPSFGAYPIGETMPQGPIIGGMSMTPAYYAPMAPMTFTVPAIPAVEDLAW